MYQNQYVKVCRFYSWVSFKFLASVPLHYYYCIFFSTGSSSSDSDSDEEEDDDDRDENEGGEGEGDDDAEGQDLENGHQLMNSEDDIPLPSDLPDDLIQVRQSESIV